MFINRSFGRDGRKHWATTIIFYISNHTPGTPSQQITSLSYLIINNNRSSSIFECTFMSTLKVGNFGHIG